MPKFSIDKTQGMGSSEIKVRPLEVNEGSSPKVGHVVITLQDGTQKTITLTQLAGERSYKYFLEVNPMDVPVDPLGSTVNVYVESYREIYVNGQMIGTEEVGYTIQGEPGITVQGDTITIGANGSNMEVVRRATVIQDESGKRVIITITQSAGSSESNYTFTADPMFVTFGTSGGSQAINIVSTKTTTVNGSTGSPVTLDYTASISPGFTWNGTSIQATENNSASELTGTLVLTQSESNLQITVQITQEAAEVSDEYQFTIDPTSSTIENTGGTLTPTIKSVHITQVGSDMQEVEVGYSWNLDNLPSWITFQDGTFTIAENMDTENPRSVSLQAVQEESNKRVTLSITQHKAEYIFLIRKNQQEEPGTEITFEYSADAGIIDRPDGSASEETDSVWLYRSWLNSGLHRIGFDASTDVDWLTVANFPVPDEFTDEDVSEPNKPGYKVQDNDSEEPRSGTVTLLQNHSGKKCYIHINQAGAVAGTSYRFSGPATITVEPEGGSINLNIQSTKQETIGGTPQGEAVDVGYTLTGNDMDWVEVTGSSPKTIQVEINTNYESDRSGTLTFKQDESEKTLTIKITQKKNTLPNGFNWGTSVNASASWFNTAFSSFRIVQNNDPAPTFTVQVYSVDNGAPVEPSAKVLEMGGRSVEDASWKVEVTSNSTPGVWDITVNYIGNMSDIVGQGSEAPVYRDNTYLLEIYQYESHWDDIHLRSNLYPRVGQGNHKRLARLILFNESAMLIIGKVPQDLDGYSLQIDYSPEDDTEINAVILTKEGSNNAANVVANYETLFWANIPNLSSYQGSYALKHCVENNLHIVFNEVTASNLPDVVSVTLQPSTSLRELVPPDKVGLLSLMLPADRNIVTFTRD